MKEIKVVAVSISEKKGTIKHPVEKIALGPLGVVNDAHAGKWNRQVSLLGTESISRFEKSTGKTIRYGEFAENITTEGLELFTTKPLDRFVNHNMILEVTQIGKKCHGSNCAIFNETGDCVMPKEGIFCRVISGGSLQAGDTLNYQPKIFRMKMITLSDRAYEGQYPDQSGPELVKLTKQYFTEQNRSCETDHVILPDDPAMLKKTLEDSIATYDVIFTTGGTGIGPRDITVETVKPFITKEIPGIMEFIRNKYAAVYPASMLSRGVAGVCGQSLIFTLPGSPNAVKEYMAEIFKILIHAIHMIHTIDQHH